MKILVDTHVFLWWVSAQERLNKHAMQLMESRDNALCFSVASSWEIAIKVSTGRLTLPEPPSTYVPSRLQAQGMASLSVELIHALQVGSLPWHHKDPFDRLLVAQAQVEDLPILTADRNLARYDVKIIWAAREPKPVANPRLPASPRRSPTVRRPRPSSVQRGVRR